MTTLSAIQDVMPRIFVLTILALLITGCASRADLELPENILEISPRAALGADTLPRGDVVWGGEIVAVDNLESVTILEVLAYPLSGYARQPQFREEPIGRFLAYQPGFLEPLTFAPGRFVTLTGLLSDRTRREVGEFEYEYPVVDVAQLHLWPADPGEWRSNVRFGVGVGVSL